MRFNGNKYMSSLGMAIFLLLSDDSWSSSTLVLEASSEDFMGKSLMSACGSSAAPLVFHTKALNYREQRLGDADGYLLKNGQYEEADFAYTNFRQYGLSSLERSQGTLLELDLESTGLKGEDVALLGSFEQLQTLNIANNYLKDGDLSILSPSLSHLQDLNLEHNFLTGGGLGFLEGLGNLKILDCGFMKLGDEGISQIVRFLPQLEALYISATSITNSSLAKLKEMPCLTRVNISYNSISASDVEEFRSNVPFTVIANHMK